MCVDLTLFPLDTIKTRLQSQQGFYKAGGFRGIYAGVPSAAVGSFPNGETLAAIAEYTASSPLTLVSGNLLEMLAAIDDKVHSSAVRNGLH